MGEVLKLLSLGARCVLHYQLLQLLDRVEQVYASASIHVVRLEEPDVSAIEEGVPHEDRGILAFLFTEVVVSLYVLVHLGESLSLALTVISTLLELILELLHHVEVVAELVKFVLAKSRPQVDHECNRDRIENVYMEILTHLGHAVEEEIFSRDQVMILKVIHEVLLAMLAQEVELNLPRGRGPLEVVQCLR